MNLQDSPPLDFFPALTERVAHTVARHVCAHEATSRLLLSAISIGGHVLLEGPPGIAKTLLAKTFAKSLDLSFNRIQFTPDLMPSDVTGAHILDSTSRAFRFVPGPIHTDIVLADEINRTPPKTQSALLEAMEERQVTVDGTRHELSSTFFVIATQNPIEHEGTFPLPEAQLDRFLFRIRLSYPSKELESQMIQALSSDNPELLLPQGLEHSADVISPSMILTARKVIRRVTLSAEVNAYLMQIVGATRGHPQILLGVSPRGALNLALAAKSEAACAGRDYVVPDDIKAVAGFVLPHRILLRPEAYESSESADELVTQIVNRIPPPGKIVGR